MLGKPGSLWGMDCICRELVGLTTVTSVMDLENKIEEWHAVSQRLGFNVQHDERK